MRSHPALLLLTACALLLAGCALPVPQEDSRTRIATLQSLGYTPMRLERAPRDKRFSGRFQVNDQTVHFLIDSGANSTDLDLNLALLAGIRPDRELQVISRGALGRPVTSQVGLGSLRAGDVSAAPFAFMLAPPSENHTATSQYDGQLGLDALEGLGSLMDVASGTLWLPGKASPNAARGGIQPLGPCPGLGYDTLRLGRAGRLPHLILQSQWNGRLLTWIVDTGAEVTVLSRHTVVQLGIPTTPTRTNIIDASGDHAPVSLANLQNVSFNRLIVSEFQVAVADLEAVREHFRDSNGRPIDGILGMDFLTESSALLDSASRLLYVGQPEITVAPPTQPLLAVPLPLTLRW